MRPMVSTELVSKSGTDCNDVQESNMLLMFSTELVSNKLTELRAV